MRSGETRDIFSRDVHICQILLKSIFWFPLCCPSPTLPGLFSVIEFPDKKDGLDVSYSEVMLTVPGSVGDQKHMKAD